MTQTTTQRDSQRSDAPRALRALCALPGARPTEPSAPRTPLMLMAATFMGGPALRDGPQPSPVPKLRRPVALRREKRHQFRRKMAG